MSSKSNGINYGARRTRKAFGLSTHAASKPPKKKKPLGFEDEDNENANSTSTR